MIETHMEDFSIESLCGDTADKLSDITEYRQTMFYKTYKYKSVENKINDLIYKIKQLNPSKEISTILKHLEDEIVNNECITFDAAYRDGMADLMTAITLNKAEITDVRLMESNNKMKEG